MMMRLPSVFVSMIFSYQPQDRYEVRHACFSSLELTLGHYVPMVGLVTCRLVVLKLPNSGPTNSHGLLLFVKEMWLNRQNILFFCSNVLESGRDTHRPASLVFDPLCKLPCCSLSASTHSTNHARKRAACLSLSSSLALLYIHQS